MKRAMIAVLAMAIPAMGAASPADETIERLLDLSGWRSSLSALPAQVVAGVRQGGAAGGAPESVQESLARIYSGAYSAEAFVEAARRSLRRDYDEAIDARFLEMLSSPLAMRVAEAEAAPMTAGAIRDYAKTLATHPPSARRAELIGRLEEVLRAGEMLSRVAMVSVDSNAFATLGKCGGDPRKIVLEAEKKRPQVEKAMRNAALAILYYANRNISDPELSAYLSIYDDEENARLQDDIQRAVATEFLESARRAYVGVGNYLAAGSCAPAADDEVRSVSEPRALPELTVAPKAALRVVKMRDLRECLKLRDDASIIACTERSR